MLLDENLIHAEALSERYELMVDNLRKSLSCFAIPLLNFDRQMDGVFQSVLLMKTSLQAMLENISFDFVSLNQQLMTLQAELSKQLISTGTCGEVKHENNASFSIASTANALSADVDCLPAVEEELNELRNSKESKNSDWEQRIINILLILIAILQVVISIKALDSDPALAQIADAENRKLI